MRSRAKEMVVIWGALMIGMVTFAATNNTAYAAIKAQRMSTNYLDIEMAEKAKGTYSVKSYGENVLNFQVDRFIKRLANELVNQKGRQV